MSLTSEQLISLKQQITSWAAELGFQGLGISDIDLASEEPKLQAWLDQKYHGQMDYMANHGMMRARPAELVPGTQRVISVRMDYLPEDANFSQDLSHKTTAYISRYAMGRDYHKLMRNRLKKLGQKISDAVEHSVQFRPFVDSAPVLERPLAQKAGLGWEGKHTLILNENAGSWFFLGELFIDLPLPIDEPVEDKCGSCVACITMCPTQAIVAPHTVDANRCISYLTIELNGAIPIEFRSLIGNRIYGCDDCQLVCPWNRYAELSCEDDFQKRKQVDGQALLALWQWDEATFLKQTEGSAIRRIGFERWQRNIAVALGNAPYHTDIIQQLKRQLTAASDLVKEHILWAVEQQQNKKDATTSDSKNKRLIRIIEKGLPRDA
ncbi:tRNA epoxyqueuosine(34) reductase QueG [Algibacillus agarilyticus]|uniref:tRNA epoxyqueuosine(34) reductase QueG n=1 Tax=Algibacillus agarilyticus TaxID=2234133 RepID=UPI000DD00514|nr:tRNA epoxyqueuosine(34) reductase QueG [Algibacillus agarilyticus]